MHALNVYLVNLYLHEYLKPILFFDPMGYGPWSKRENGPNLRRSKISKSEKPRSSKLVCMHFRSTSTCTNFSSQFHFLTPMDYSPWFKREIWLFLKVAISPKLERPRQPKLVCMHLTSTPTCMNFFS